MQKKALVIIDIQNDITKNYKDVIGNINQAIGRPIIKFMLFILDMKIYPQARGHLNRIPTDLNLLRT